MNRRKLVATVLAGSLLFSVPTVPASACQMGKADTADSVSSAFSEKSYQQDGVSYQLTYRELDDSTVEIVGCSGNPAGTLILPASIDNKPVTGIGNGAFSEHGEFTGELIIPESVIVIGRAAFSGCSGLTAVTVPDSVVALGEKAFSGCTGLTTVTLSDRLTSLETDLFFECISLTDLIIPTGVAVIKDKAFYNCRRLASVAIPISVNLIWDGAFEGCTALQNIFYSGTEMDWESVLVKNSPLTPNEQSLLRDGVDIHYNTTPTNGDSPSDWATEEVRKAIRMGIVSEKLQGSYQKPVTRAEFCTLLVDIYERRSGMAIKGRTAFADTDDVDVEKMASLGVVRGTGNGAFCPDGYLTRQEAAVMLDRLTGVMGRSLNSELRRFADGAEIADWAADSVYKINASGIMVGIGGDIFCPLGLFSREQSIITALRLYTPGYDLE